MASSPSTSRAMSGIMAIVMALLVLSTSMVMADFRTSLTALRANAKPSTASLSSLQHNSFVDPAPLKAVLDALPSVHSTDSSMNTESLDNDDDTASTFGTWSLNTATELSGEDGFSDAFSEGFSMSMSLSMSLSFSGDSGLSLSDFSFEFSESGGSGFSEFSQFSGSEPFSGFSGFSGSEFSDDSGDFSDFSFSGFSGSGFSGSGLSGSGFSGSMSGEGPSCIPNPCRHGGQCILDIEENSVSCECEDEWTGDNCESPAPPTSIEDFDIVVGTPAQTQLVATFSPASGAPTITHTVEVQYTSDMSTAARVVATPGDLSSGTYTITIDGLDAGTEYRARVEAQNSVGTSYSAWVLVETQASGPAQLDAPTFDHVSAYWVDLHWSLPTSPDVADLAGYKIIISSADDTGADGYQFDVNDGAATYARVFDSDGQLTVGATYTFTIAAIDINGNEGILSDPSADYTTALGAPWGLSNITVTAVTLDTITATWLEPFDLNSELLEDTTFSVEATFDLSGSLTTQTFQVQGELSITLTGLRSGRIYTLRYRAINVNDQSDLNTFPVVQQLPVLAPRIQSFKAQDNPTTPQVSISEGDLVIITFDKATNKPALTNANLGQFVEWIPDGAAPTPSATYSPVWNADGSVLTITLASPSATGWVLGKLRARIAGTIQLRAAASLGGSDVTSATSGPLGGNFGFGDDVVTVPPDGESGIPILEDTPTSFGDLGTTFSPPGTNPITVTVSLDMPGGTVTVIQGGTTLTGTKATPLEFTEATAGIAALYLTIVYTPAPDWNGIDTILVDCVQGGNQIYFQSLTIDVRPVNDAPVITSPTQRVVNVDQIFDLSLPASPLTISDVDVVLNPAAALTVSVITSDSLHQCHFKTRNPAITYVPSFVGINQPYRQKLTAYGKVSDVSGAMAQIECRFGLADPSDISLPQVSIAINDGANGADPDDADPTPGVAGADINILLSCTAATLAPPTLRFSNDATAVLIEFPVTVIIDTPANFDCSGWFNAAGVTALGVGAECYGVGPDFGRTILQAVLGKGSTVSPTAMVSSSTLTLQAFKRCPTSTPTWPGGTLPIAVATAPILPTIDVDAPANSAACSPLNLAAFASGVADRNAVYTWTSSVPSVIAGLPGLTTSSLAIPSSRLTGGTTYTFTVAVTNFVQATSLVESFDIAVSAKNIADVRVTGPKEFFAADTGNVEFAAVAELPACAAAGDAFTFSYVAADATLNQWLIDNGRNTGTKLIIPKAQFTNLAVYTFTVTATLSSDPTTTASATFTTEVKFKGAVQPPAYVQGFTNAAQSFSWSLAGLRRSGWAINYQAAVTCTAPGGVQCQTTKGANVYTLPPTTITAVNTLLTSSSAKQVSVALDTDGTGSLLANTMLPGTYTFTLIIKFTNDPTNWVSSSVTVKLDSPPRVSGGSRRLLQTASGKPRLTLSCVRGCSPDVKPVIAPGQLAAFVVDALPQAGTNANQIVTTTYSWEITPSARLNLAGVVSNQKWFTLNPMSTSGYFTAGAVYNLAVTVTMTLTGGAVHSSTSYLQLLVNTPPRSGSLTIPTTNAESVPVELTAPAWYDANGGITYQFYTYDDSTPALRFDISSVQQSPKYMWSYPVAGYGATPQRTIGCSVVDSLGATTRIETVVTITPMTAITDGTTAATYINREAANQNAKGSTEGINQLSVQVTNALSGATTTSGAATLAIPLNLATDLRNTMLTKISMNAPTTTPSTFSAIMQASTSSVAQLNGQSASLATSSMMSSLSLMNPSTLTGSASLRTINSAVGIASTILQSAGSVSGARRLLSIGDSDLDSKRAATNATYAMLLDTLSAASRSVLVNPGQKWESLRGPVYVGAQRFAASAGVTAFTTLAIGSIGAVSIAVPAAISATPILDLHAIYESPNPFTWDSASILVGPSVLVRVATTGGVAATVTTGEVAVTIPFSLTACPPATCSAACVQWTASGQWVTTGVTSTAGSVAGTVVCGVDVATVGAKFTLSVKFTVPTLPPSSTGTVVPPFGETVHARLTLNIPFAVIGAVNTTFDAQFIQELAAAVVPSNENVASYIPRFGVTTKASVSDNAGQMVVGFDIYDSQTGLRSAAIYKILLDKLKAGQLQGGLLGTANGITMECSDNVQRITCDNTPEPEPSSSMGLIIGIVVGVVAFFIIVGIAVYCYRKNRPPKIHDSSAHTGDTAAATAPAP